MNASTKIMLSYDYCHFEIALSDDVDNLEAVDGLRKDTQRLADKAVAQYKIAKMAENTSAAARAGLKRIEREVAVIKENFPKSEWTPEQKAKVKVLEDVRYRASLHYDYNDDWEGGPWEDEVPF